MLILDAVNFAMVFIRIIISPSENKETFANIMFPVIFFVKNENIWKTLEHDLQNWNNFLRSFQLKSNSDALGFGRSSWSSIIDSLGSKKLMRMKQINIQMKK